jgi:hypothetical protein
VDQLPLRAAALSLFMELRMLLETQLDQVLPELLPKQVGQELVVLLVALRPAVAIQIQAEVLLLRPLCPEPIPEALMGLGQLAILDCQTLTAANPPPLVL